MGQQPNIEIEIEDLPRATAHPAAPRRWSPTRPGELHSPDQVPWGGAFGTPGPDSGYAMTILARRDIEVGPGEAKQDAAAALAALMSARASRFGRAPVPGDADVAARILGYGTGADEEVAAARLRLVEGAAHSPARRRAVVAAVDAEVLQASLDDIAEPTGARRAFTA